MENLGKFCGSFHHFLLACVSLALFYAFKLVILIYCLFKTCFDWKGVNKIVVLHLCHFQNIILMSLTHPTVLCTLIIKCLLQPVLAWKGLIKLFLLFSR